MEENNNTKKGTGIIYGVIMIATLIISIIGATFAYFTASRTNSNRITGNAATVSFGLTVQKITDADEIMGGLIPMSNSMVEPAISNICKDSNDNAVCQVYKITVTNNSTATLFVDGYVSLDGGLRTSGASTDDSSAPTVMRWAQAFCTGSNSKDLACSTAGTSTVRPDSGTISIASIDPTDNTAAGAHNTSNLYTSTTASRFALGSTTIGSNSYEVINKNYIRSSYDVTGAYTHADLDSALVINQNLAPDGETNSSVDLYIVVWLSETGTNQTPSAAALNFFSGTVTFNSARGGEVTATFNGYTRVAPTY